MKNLYFIAELGQNHQGEIKIAKQMVDALVGSGVSAIKTAKRDIDVCLSDEQKKMPYINENSFGETYYEHRKALELSDLEFEDLKNYIGKNGFDFIPSFTDKPSFDLIKSLGCKKIKIASQRIKDISLLKHVSKNHKGTIYMSSGMSELDDIEKMIEIFKNNKKYLLQCTSVYPCDDDFLDLRVLKKYRHKFKNKVNGFGFSSHNRNIGPDIAAVALGARVIERHFTLDRTWRGSDHKVSLEINQFKKLIKYAEQAYRALGDSEKKIHEKERPAMARLQGDLRK